MNHNVHSISGDDPIGQTAGITILGLGPGHPDYLTREAWTVLESAPELWLRTEHHPAVAGLPSSLVVHSFDRLYEEAENFGELYERIAGHVLELGRRPQGVVYAVPGHPLVGEATVKHLLARAREEGLPVRIVAGVSFIEPVLTVLQIDALPGLQICDALEIAARHHPPLNPDLPALVAQMYDRLLASDVKLTLMNQYPDDHEVVLVYRASMPEQSLVRLPLYALDRQDMDHLTTLYIPQLTRPGGFESFQDTVAHLRAPNGCPWDREQTHESLRGSLLEEAYETLAAIDAGDLRALQEELGDLLLQVLIQTQIATEAGEFKMIDVIAGIDAKLKYRHPHVWGTRHVNNAQEVLQHWERLKRAEKGDARSVLDGIPAALPALQQADVYSRRAARVGFDWSSPDGVADKVREEMEELERAADMEEREAELGDLLFAIVNWARWLGLDAETALRKANARFARRFRTMERMAQQQGVDMSALTMEELESLWQKAKDDDA
ncbi:MAG: nucleoside triphosphate pyrophosphohydrolase [Anaerolineae bacterium]|nr:nucleoside triphosphate pyrophosphohydrolase [Anaerolineae bacterium]